MKKISIWTTAMTILLLLISPLLVHANTSNNENKIESKIQNQTNEQGKLDIKPIQPSSISNGFDRMGNDLDNVGKSMAKPAAVISFIVTAVFLLLGYFFKKLRPIAGFAFVGSIIILILLGNPMGTADKLLNGIYYVLSYFE